MDEDSFRKVSNSHAGSSSDLQYVENDMITETPVSNAELNILNRVDRLEETTF